MRRNKKKIKDDDTSVNLFSMKKFYKTNRHCVVGHHSCATTADDSRRYRYRYGYRDTDSDTNYRDTDSRSDGQGLID